MAMHLHQNPEFQGTVVTLNGDMIESNGFITGGSPKMNLHDCWQETGRLIVFPKV
ncbi:MAG: hypothetical protein Ct9H300mP23_11090 [Nitrospinota bacterium]|nr:MAG: hypothetical protein Ct9H300mP23_11090 [Nitrospinota bacterium]